MSNPKVHALSDVLVARLQARALPNSAGLVPGATCVWSFRPAGANARQDAGSIVAFHSYLAVVFPRGTVRCYDHPIDGWMIGLEGEPDDLSRFVAETNFKRAWDKAKRTHDQLWSGNGGRAVKDQTNDRQTYRKRSKDMYVDLDATP